MKYATLFLCFPFICASSVALRAMENREKGLTKPIIIPKEMIIYPPTTTLEFLERRRILKEAFLCRGIEDIVLNDKKPKDTSC